MENIKIVMVDDHPMIREVLRHLINAQDDMSVSGEAEDAATALAMIENHRPDVVLLDISLPQANGLDLIARIKAEFPAVRVVMLSMHHNTVYVTKAFHQGAHGYVLKGVNSCFLLTAIRKAYSGEYYLCQEVRGDVPPGFLDNIRKEANLI